MSFFPGGRKPSWSKTNISTTIRIVILICMTKCLPQSILYDKLVTYLTSYNSLLVDHGMSPFVLKEIVCMGTKHVAEILQLVHTHAGTEIDTEKSSSILCTIHSLYTFRDTPIGIQIYFLAQNLYSNLVERALHIC